MFQEVPPEYAEVLYYSGDHILEEIAQRGCGSLSLSLLNTGGVKELSGQNPVECTLGQVGPDDSLWSLPILIILICFYRKAYFDPNSLKPFP